MSRGNLLCSAAARNKSDRYLWVTKDRFANGGETHIRGQRDLAPPASSPALDFGNDDLGHVPEPLADRLRETEAACMRHQFGSGPHPAQTGMRYKELGKRALQDHNPDLLIGLEFPAKFVEFLRKNFIKKIYRRVIDADKSDAGVYFDLDTFVARILHGDDSFFR
jgi:hypothetical protein